MSKPDKIYARMQPVADFVFDDKVAEVFTDMINRSVPGYATIISMIGMLAERYCVPGTAIYDLGCSLGGATLSMRHHLSHENYRLVAVDNSAAMIRRLRETLAQAPLPDTVELVCADIADISPDKASVVVLNFTLQFIPPDDRDELIRRIYNGMIPGGILILSEKIRFTDTALNALMIDMYHQFKQAQGYSQLEISQKRSALENVLIPESIAEHRDRISKAGFSSFDPWFQCFNFASMIAFK
jgi:tRNA (cmo5U34)-methyltransferase